MPCISVRNSSGVSKNNKTQLFEFSLENKVVLVAKYNEKLSYFVRSKMYHLRYIHWAYMRQMCSMLRECTLKGPFSGKHARYVVYWSPKETRKKERGNYVELIIQTL